MISKIAVWCWLAAIWFEGLISRILEWLRAWLFN